MSLSTLERWYATQCNDEWEHAHGVRIGTLATKSLIALALLLCLCAFLPASDAQSEPKRIQPIPYRDTDGYQVLSSILEARTEKLENGSVAIFHQTLSGDALGNIPAECSSRIPTEFQSALSDFHKKAGTKLLLQQQFSIHKEYKFV